MAENEPDSILAVPEDRPAVRNAAPSLPSAVTPPVPVSKFSALPSHDPSKLDEFLNRYWGMSGIPEESFGQIIKYVNPDMVKPTKTGFALQLLDGHVLEVSAAPGQEMIAGPKTGFHQEDADAMVVLAKLHGWKQIKVSGTTEDKEMLWLAVQRQNLLDKEIFERSGEEGIFMPMTVANFKPTNPQILRLAAQGKAAYQAKRKAMHDDTPEAAAGPEEAAPEAISEPFFAEPSQEIEMPAFEAAPAPAPTAEPPASAPAPEVAAKPDVVPEKKKSRSKYTHLPEISVSGYWRGDQYIAPHKRHAPHALEHKDAAPAEDKKPKAAEVPKQTKTAEVSEEAKAAVSANAQKTKGQAKDGFSHLNRQKHNGRLKKQSFTKNPPHRYRKDSNAP